MHFTGRKEPITCTPEHPFYISEIGPNWTNKKSISYGNKIIKATNWKPVCAAKLYEANKNHDALHVTKGNNKPKIFENDVIDFNGIPIKITKSIARLIGLYSAEGFSRRNEINFAFHVEEDFTKEVQNLLKENFLLETKIVSRNKDNCSIVQSTKAGYVKEFFDYFCGKGSAEKGLHSSIFSWENSLLKEIWLGFLDGDGHIKDENRIIQTTVSKQLARDLFRIALRLSMHATLRYSDPKISHGVKTRRRRYNVEVIIEANTRNRIETQNSFVSPIKKIEKISALFNGLVYNLEVEDDHSYVADQIIVHNCVAYSWMHWIEDGPVTHFYEGRDFDPAYLNEHRVEKHESLFVPKAIYDAAQKIDEWPGECVDVETTCLTKQGWKKFDQLKNGEEILTFNLQTEKTEWLPLEKIHLHENVKYGIWKNKAIELACTDNHKWPVRSRVLKNKYELVETKNWKSQHEFPRVAKCSDLPKMSEWSNDFVSLVAWTITASVKFVVKKKNYVGIIVTMKDIFVEHCAQIVTKVWVCFLTIQYFC